MKDAEWEQVNDLIRSKDFVGLQKLRKEEFDRIAKSYNRGYISMEEVDRQTELVVCKNAKDIRKMFDMDSLDYNIALMVYEDLLSTRRNEGYKGQWFLSLDKNVRDEFSCEDILNIYNSLYIPAVFVRGIDKSIPSPQISCNHVWNDSMALRIPFECIDDGGLFSDDDPEGKSFVLTRVDGVKARISVSKYIKGVSVKEAGKNADFQGIGNNEYRCIGDVDDYYFRNTNPASDNICIYGDRIDNLKVLYIMAYFEPGKSPYSADFPRWKEYNEACEKYRNDLNDEIVRIRKEAVFA